MSARNGREEREINMSLQMFTDGGDEFVIAVSTDDVKAVLAGVHWRPLGFGVRLAMDLFQRNSPSTTRTRAVSKPRPSLSGSPNTGADISRGPI